MPENLVLLPLKATGPHLPEVSVGDKIRFKPGSHQRNWWKVVARDDEHVVAVRQRPFHEKGEPEYTVTEWREYKYNGQGPGLVRSSLNTLGGGWDIDLEGNGAQEILDGLRSGHWETSNRRLLSIWEVEVKKASEPDPDEDTWEDDGGK